jgi:hypothetical protein
MENIMMYSQKFVAVVKASGRVLREKGDTVYVPFGSEYSIVLKNLNSVKAVVKVSVDGDDTLDGNEIIVGANSTAELEGFMKGRKVSNKFKFIEKTAQIAEYRGNKVSDGLIRISFRFETEIPEATWINTGWPAPSYYDNRGYQNRSSGTPPSDITWTSSNYTTNTNTTKSKGVDSNVACSYSAQSVSSGATLGCMRAMPANEDGITVKGSESKQQFRLGTVGILEETEHVIVLNLKGQLKNRPVKKAVTVRTKVTCETCGKKSKSSNRFCNNCGTALF